MRSVKVTWTNSITFSVPDEFDEEQLSALGNSVSAFMPKVSAIRESLNEVGCKDVSDVCIQDEDFLSHEEEIKDVYHG